MTADDSQASRDVAAGGHDAALADATGPTAAAAFAGHILSKYFVAPVVRRGPSLVLRMLQTAGRGDGAGVMKSAAAAANAPTDAPAPPAVRIALAADRRAAAPSSGRPTVRVPDLSRPAPVSASRSLVQRKPLVGAPGETGASAMTAISPRAPSVALTMAGHPATAIAAPGADRRQTRANAMTPPVAGHGILEQRTSSIATTHGAPPRAPDLAAGKAPAPTASASASAGAPPHASSRLGSDLLRRVLVPGLHRLVQRKSLAWRSADTPAAAVVSRSSGVKPAVAAAGHKNAATSPFNFGSHLSSIDPGQPRLATFAHHRPLRQRKPPTRRGADAVIGASGFTAAPIGSDTRQFASTMPLTTLTYGRGAVFPDGRTAAARWQPARAPITHGQVLDPLLPAELDRNHDGDAVLHSPAMTHRVNGPAAPHPGAGARPMAAELTLRSSRADARPVPTVVAATLGVAAPAPAPQNADKAMESNQASTVSSMPIQMLADRVFRILERRLVVERERRGIRL
jgi:hypothetical protein